MDYLDSVEELNGNEKYAIGNIVDGLITFVRETKYLDYDEDVIALFIKVYKDERGLDIEHLIKELEKML
jgi:hypothetical protein